MLGDLLRGFLAAAISVVLVHQLIVFILNRLGLWEPKAYSMAPIGPLQLPTIVNSIFWGGMWGVVYVLTRHLLPDLPLATQGALFGLLMLVFSNSLVVPLLKGQPIFFGFDLKKILAVALILSCFGAGMAYFNEALTVPFAPL
ncbi:MAG: hypothetical protein ABL894_00020 [Hyphomicrobium sp.]